MIYLGSTLFHGFTPNVLAFQEGERERASERKLSAQTKSTHFRLFGFDMCTDVSYTCIPTQVFACLLLCFDFDFVLALHECRCTCDTFHAFMSKSHIIFTYLGLPLCVYVCLCVRACGCLRMHIIASTEVLCCSVM